MGLPGGVKTRDAAAAVIFVVPFFASWITELACGPSWENCAPLAWVPLSAADVPYSHHYHCIPKPDGLGDPALSVGSLQFAAAIAYLELNNRFSMLPVVAVFVGITSFLFHARNTVPHHRLDLTGVALLAPGLFDTAVAGRWPPSDTTPRTALVAFRAFLLVASIVALALVHPTMPNWDPLWTITITYGSLALAVYVYGYWSTWDDPDHKSANRATVAGLLLFVLAILLLLVGNYHEYWTCVITQLSEPHYWGHFFGAAAVALLSRSSSSASDNDDGYQKL